MTNKRHLWSGRFSDSPDRDFFQFQSSFRFDKRLFEDDIKGSLAWVEALARAGALSSSDASVIRDGLTGILELGRKDPTFIDGSDEDVHAFVERQLVERIGNVGLRLHTGRSRNEQVSLDLRLYLRRRLLVLQKSIVLLITALVDQATAAGSTLIPAYTHLRRAQPMLVAHFFLAHVAALRRDHLRFSQARDEADALPLGSGAAVGTSYNVDPQLLATQLGFSRVVENSLDAVSDRDFVSSTLHACSLLMVHLSRLSEDLIIFAGEEFGFFELADRVATGSSLMPQKKNPDSLELIRGKSGRLIGHLIGWLTTMKGLPSGYNKDLQEDKEVLFDSEQEIINSLKAMTTVIESLEVKIDNSQHAATGLLLATDVADYLVNRGLPFRSAHEVVGKIVRDLLECGRDFTSLTLADWQQYHELFDEGVTQCITSWGSVEARKTSQSTHPQAVKVSIENVRTWITAQT